MTFNELMTDLINNKAFSLTTVGKADSGETVYFSEGVKRTYKDIAAADVTTALHLFLNGNYGNFYDSSEKPTPGNEYGEYKSIYGSTADTGAIMLHRENGTIKVYFQFER